MIVDLERIRRIRTNLAAVRRLLRENPEKTARFLAWFKEQEDEDNMVNEVAIALRLPSDLLQQLDELVPVIATAGDLAATRVSRSTVIRLALIRGVAELRRDFGVSGAPAKKRGKPKAR